MTNMYICIMDRDYSACVRGVFCLLTVIVCVFGHVYTDSHVHDRKNTPQIAT